MNKQAIKTSVSNAFKRSRDFFGIPVLIVAGLAVLLLGITVFQKYCDKRDAAQVDAKVEKLDGQATRSSENFERGLELFNKQNEATQAVLNTVGELTKTVKILVDNDQKQDRELQNFLKDYKNARFQKNDQNSVNNGTFRNNRPLLEREQGVLAADRELYPND